MEKICWQANRVIPTTFVVPVLSHDLDSNAICRGLFCLQWFEVKEGCSFWWYLRNNWPSLFKLSFPNTYTTERSLHNELKEKISILDETLKFNTKFLGTGKLFDWWSYLEKCTTFTCYFRLSMEMSCHSTRERSLTV
jgi:hypothetical protein